MPEPQRIPVRQQAGVGQSSRAARALALEIGFSPLASEEIALVAIELATNVVKHAVQGEVTLEAVEEGGRKGLRMESHDVGPGITDVSRAFADGVSTAGTLGFGLGTVHRLMDEVEIASVPDIERGTRIICTRWTRADARPSRNLPLSFGVMARPRPGGTVNGDAYLIKRWGENALVAVIDGLGHGQLAMRASQTAREYVERHYDLPMDRMFEGADRACRGTRGVVMAVARWELLEHRLTFASVGNIEARLIHGSGREGLLVRRGVVGSDAPAPTVRQYVWRPDSMLVLHSDGLTSRWSTDDIPGLAELTANEAAQRLFTRLHTRSDDSVVLVVKGVTQVIGQAERGMPEGGR